MAYELKRSKKIIEEIKLDNGTIIKAELNIHNIIMEYTKAYNNMIRLEKKLQDLTPENTDQLYEEIGQTVIKLMQIIFGNQNTDILLKYYENNYFELAENMQNFIINKIQPHFNDYNKQKAIKKNQYLGK